MTAQNISSSSSPAAPLLKCQKRCFIRRRLARFSPHCTLRFCPNILASSSSCFRILLSVGFLPLPCLGLDSFSFYYHLNQKSWFSCSKSTGNLLPPQDACDQPQDSLPRSDFFGPQNINRNRQVYCALRRVYREQQFVFRAELRVTLGCRLSRGRGVDLDVGTVLHRSANLTSGGLSSANFGSSRSRSSSEQLGVLAEMVLIFLLRADMMLSLPTNGSSVLSRRQQQTNFDLAGESTSLSKSQPPMQILCRWSRSLGSRREESHWLRVQSCSNWTRSLSVFMVTFSRSCCSLSISGPGYPLTLLLELFPAHVAQLGQVVFAGLGRVVALGQLDELVQLQLQQDALRQLALP